ncbi:hypothetical protein Dimus_006836 [Dionaea muscipula]
MPPYFAAPRALLKSPSTYLKNLAHYHHAAHARVSYRRYILSLCLFVSDDEGKPIPASFLSSPSASGSYLSQTLPFASSAAAGIQFSWPPLPAVLQRGKKSLVLFTPHHKMLVNLLMPSPSELEHAPQLVPLRTQSLSFRQSKFFQKILASQLRKIGNLKQLVVARPWDILCGVECCVAVQKKVIVAWLVAYRLVYREKVGKEEVRWVYMVEPGNGVDVDHDGGSLRLV